MLHAPGALLGNGVIAACVDESSETTSRQTSDTQKWKANNTALHQELPGTLVKDSGCLTSGAINPTSFRKRRSELRVQAFLRKRGFLMLPAYCYAAALVSSELSHAVRCRGQY